MTEERDPDYRAHQLPPGVRSTLPEDPDVIVATGGGQGGTAPTGTGERGSSGDGGGGGRLAPANAHYLYRADEILVAAPDEALIARRLASNRLYPDPDPNQGALPAELGVMLYRLQRQAGRRYADDYIPKLVDRLRRPLRMGPHQYRVPRVGPNTILTFEWHGEFGPATPPLPDSSTLRKASDNTTGAGRGVQVHVIDTGFSPGDPTWFGSQASQSDPDPLDVDAGGRLQWYSGHGTHIAGTILRYAPAAKVVVHRLQNAGGTFADSDLALMIKKVGLSPGVDILSLSLAAATHGNAGLIAIDAAIQTLRAQRPKMAIVASAGNDGVDVPTFPAASKGVFAVGATDAAQYRAGFSNYGNWVDCCTVGVDVLGPFVKHPDFPAPFFARWSGTSFSAPAFAGMVARVLSPGSSPKLPPFLQGAQSARDAASRLVNDPSSPPVPELGTFVALASLL